VYGKSLLDRFHAATEELIKSEQETTAEFTKQTKVQYRAYLGEGRIAQRKTRTLGKEKQASRKASC
jgi:hypothetical protein